MSKEILHLLIEHTPVAIAIFDRQMCYLAASRRWLKDYHLDNQNIIGTCHYELFPETSVDWRQIHQKCLAGASEKCDEDSFLHPDGTLDWLKWEIYPWRDREGEIGGIVIFTEIITEQKLLADKLRTSETKTRAVLEVMKDIVLVIDTQKEEVEVIPTNFSYSSLDREIETIEQTIEKLFSSSKVEQFSLPIQQALISQQTVSFEYSLPTNDSIKWYIANISPMSDSVVVWVARDITERKRIEQNLFAEKELAQVTLKSIGDAVMTTDDRGIIRDLNPIAEQLTGWQEKQAQGCSWNEVFRVVDEETQKPLSNIVQQVLQENCVINLSEKALLIARDGKEHAIEESASPIRDRQGRPIGTVIVFHDVTESRQLSRQLSWQATHDALTGLYNRREFERQVTLAIASARESGHVHVLCYLDLDRFKIVNDTCGHAAGDQILREVTILLQTRVRYTDILARLGGDEFGLLLPQCPFQEGQKIANILRKLIEDFCFSWQGQHFSLGVSIGVVKIDRTSKNWQSVLRAADTACYAAKARGRNCVYVS